MQARNLTEQKLALFLLDMAFFFCALNISIYLRYSASLPFTKGGPPPWREIFVAYPWVALVWVVAGAVFGAYRPRQTLLRELSAVFRSTLFTFLAVLSATFFYRGFSYSRGMIVFFIPAVLVLVSLERIAFRALRRSVLVRFAGRSKVTLLGRSRIGDTLATALTNDHEYYEVVGWIDVRKGSTPTTDTDVTQGQSWPCLGSIADLDHLCEIGSFDMLVVVERDPPDSLVLESLETCLRHQVSWNMIPRVHDLLLDRVQVALVDGIPLVGMRGTNIVSFNWAAKRLFDVLVSSLLLLLAAPLMIAVVVGIRLSSSGPILHVQRRIGYRGQPFTFLKFRSMHVGNNDQIHRDYTRVWITENRAHNETDGNKTYKITNDPRIFPVGRIIRKYSIDELPQLINVLRGDMSLVGPRPALPYEVEVYREWHRRRFEAPPGLTGLWQVSGRSRLSFEEMIKLDIDYLENWSFLRDVQIIWRTVRVVLFEHAV